MHSVINKKFYIPINVTNDGAIWYMSFKSINNEITHQTLSNKINVIQEDVKNKRVIPHECTYKISKNEAKELIYISIYRENETNPYTWMVTQPINSDKEPNLRLWVAGQGGAMDFPMTFDSNV